MQVCVPQGKLFGSVRNIFCGTWHELRPSHAGIPRTLMAVAQALGSDRGIVMKLKSTSHNRNEKVKVKLPFLDWESNTAKKMCIYLKGFQESPRCKVFCLLFRQNLCSLVAWVLCDLQTHFNSDFFHRRDKRRGHLEFSPIPYWLLKHFHSECILLHLVVCSTWTQSLATWHFLSQWPLTSAQKVAVDLIENANTHKHTSSYSVQSNTIPRIL